MSRKNPGEGSTSQRANGTWQAALQVHGVRRTVYGKTEGEVKKKLAKLRQQAATTNRLPRPGRRTVADLIDFWLDTAKESYKPRTVANYKWLADRHIKPHVGHLPLSQLEPAHLQMLYRQLREMGHRRVASQVHIALHHCLKLAVLWNWLPDNAADSRVWCYGQAFPVGPPRRMPYPLARLQ